MTVFVDDMKASYGRMFMCHMIANSTRELNEMADSIRSLSEVDPESWNLERTL